MGGESVTTLPPWPRLTKSNNDNISNVHTTDAFTDHFSITCTLHILTSRSQINATVSFHKYYKINKEKMKTDLIASDLINNPSKDADTLYEQYHSTLTILIDKHAPLHIKHTKYIPGWVNKAVIAAKETMRLFERIWRRKKISLQQISIHAESPPIQQNLHAGQI